MTASPVPHGLPECSTAEPNPHASLTPRVCLRNPTHEQSTGWICAIFILM